MRDLTIDSANLYIRDKTQLFVDNLMVESAQDVSRRWYNPERKPDAPVIVRDRPWEHTPYFTWSNHAILFDPTDRLFKCWYEDLIQIPENFMRQGVLMFHARQLYAYSEDGISWVKPELDVLMEDGRRTNIVLGGGDYGQVHSMGIAIDPYPPTTEERFRAIYTWMREECGQVLSSITSAHSPDGIHWTPYTEAPTMGLCGSQLDDCSICYYDEDAREFVQNTRHYAMYAAGYNLRSPVTGSFLIPYMPNHPLMMNKRRVWQSRSHDFIHWSELVPIAAPDNEDEWDDSYYAMSNFKVGTQHLATVGVFHGVENTMEVQLLHSRDGVRWSNAMQRRPFFSPRGEGHWDAHMVAMTSPPVEVGDELLFFFGGCNCHHDWWLVGDYEHLDLPESDKPENVRFGLGVARMRKDGFVGVYANKHREGILVTPATLSLGTKLYINARCNPGGSIRVEVADMKDDVLEPCAKDNCDTFTGDSTSHLVTWNGSPDIPAGGELYNRKLRFFIRDGELFSFRFAEEMK